MKITQTNEFDYDLFSRLMQNEACRNDILTFGETMFPVIEGEGKQMLINWHTRVISNRLNQLKVPKAQRYMIFLPPQVGKSFFVSRLLPAWFLGHNPSMRVLLFSYSAALAHTFNRDVQALTSSIEYQQTFPDTVTKFSDPSMRRLSNIRLRATDDFFNTSQNGSLSTLGIEGSGTGKKGDLIIIDDPFKGFKEGMSPAMQETVWSFYHSVAKARAHLHTPIIIMHTRWNVNDLAGRLLQDVQNGKGEDWEILSFPMILDDEDTKHHEDPRKVGEALWPEFKGDKAHVEKLKKSTPELIWAATFQQTPVVKGGNLINPDNFVRYDELPDKLDGVLISCDLAFKDYKKEVKNNKRSFVAFGVIGWKGKDIYLIHVTRGKWGFSKTKTELIKYLKNIEYDKILIEDKANGPALVSDLGDYFPEMELIPAIESKEERAMLADTTTISVGRFHVPNENNHPWMVPYLKEFNEFPLGINDDMVDITTQAINYIRSDVTSLNDYINAFK